MNLCLYPPPPHSAHPPGVLTGILSGDIIYIHSLCSNKEDTNCRMKELDASLLVRGYQRDLLITMFAKLITRARAFIKCGSVQ